MLTIALVALLFLLLIVFIVSGHDVRFEPSPMVGPEYKK